MITNSLKKDDNQSSGQFSFIVLQVLNASQFKVAKLKTMEQKIDHPWP
jgi:hypothetical protein